MGKLKDLMIQMQGDSFGVQLAEILGISYMDLSMLQYDIDTEESNDGLVYNYIIKFSKNSPSSILSKIKIPEDGIIRIAASDIDTSREDYYEEQFDAITSNKHFYTSFIHEIENLEKLSSLNLPNLELNGILLRQIFISVFGTLEIFLSDTFINLTLEKDEYLKNFVESHPDFKKRKLDLSEIFSSYENIKDVSTKIMIDTIYHDLPKIKEMYKSTFKIEFPELNEIMKSVSTRHDLVHRNGKTKQGATVIIDKAIIDNLILLIKTFVSQIADQLKLPKSDFPF